ncbi:glycoside hydrolase family protein [Devosia submarina]|uniref:glycoside hydrolase family protein n=1 Tax=Devosia submarina TaxID=1173082 RepID=UPI000D368624|nr:peptidoglycan-binding protein [Devosia submarina]
MLTTRIVRFIGGHEGFVSTMYLDPTGTPTIGYGFTWGSRVFREWWTAKYGRKMRKGDTIGQNEAYEVLLKVLDAEYLPPVEAKMPTAPINVKEPALSVVFNAGAGALAWKWAAACARGDYKGAANLWRNTATTSKGKRLPGLVRRRNEEADIAAFDKWPTWMGTAVADVPPETHVDEVDVKQAQLWLNDLGYQLGRADGIPGPRTVLAARRFQQDHGTLKVDGIIGPATLAALQRAIDLKRKAAQVAAGGTVTAGAGAAEGATGAADHVPTPVGDAGWLGDLLLWGGLAILVLGLAYLAWRYRDELTAALRKL